MEVFEYKVVPAPKKGKPLKGVRGAEAKFARTVSDLMNEMGAEGWDYVRADALPSEERSGLFGRKLVEHHLLVFRRVKAEAHATGKPVLPSLTSRPSVTQSAPQTGAMPASEETVAPKVDRTNPLAAVVAAAKRER